MVNAWNVKAPWLQMGPVSVADPGYDQGGPRIFSEILPM